MADRPPDTDDLPKSAIAWKFIEIQKSTREYTGVVLLQWRDPLAHRYGPARSRRRILARNLLIVPVHLGLIQPPSRRSERLWALSRCQ